MPFTESLDFCLRSSLPVLLLPLTFLAIFLAISSSASFKPSSAGFFYWRGNATEFAIDFTKNDLLLGSQDPFFWFLIPLCGLVSTGFCVVINYVALGITWLFYIPYNLLTARPAWAKHEDGWFTILEHLPQPFTDQFNRKSTVPGFAAGSPRRRIITTLVLLFMVSTFIPYQFAYLDACIVQLATCTRALRLARETVKLPPLSTWSYSDIHSDRELIIISTITPIQSSSSCSAFFRSIFPYSWFGYII